MAIKLTPEDAVKALEFLNIDASNLDEFKTKFGESFFTDETFMQSVAGKKFVGKWMPTQISRITKSVGKYGVTIGQDEMKDADGRLKEPYEVVELAIEKINSIHDAARVELEKKAGQNNDDKVDALQKNFDALQQKFKQAEDVNLEIKGQLENVTNENQSKLKEYKIKTETESIWNKIKFKSEAEYKSPTEAKLIRNGFKVEFASKYKIELDENEKAVIKTIDGKLIPSPDKVNMFLSPEEVIQKEAIAAGVLSISPRAGDRVNNSTFKIPVASENGEKAYIHPDARTS